MRNGMRHGLMALTAIAVAFAPNAGNVVGLLAARAQQAVPPIVSPTAVPADTTFTRAELEILLKPIALFPDALLAQMLPAAAYPLDIVQASRWLDKNKDAVAKKDFTTADAQAWDTAVKAMVRFPDLIRKLNADLDWTSDLGDAFVFQPEDVADVIQMLRNQAEKTGALATTPQQKVVKRTEAEREVIIIEPSDPEVIYVPQYDPVTVYDSGIGTAVGVGLLTFGTAVAVGALVNNNYWNWGTGAVYPPRWGGYPGYGGRPGGINNGNINIGNDINIGGGSNVIGNSKPWSPDRDRYRAGQGTKPGLANTRPGGPGGVGGPGRPGGIGGVGGAGGAAGIGGPGGVGGVGGPGGIGGAGGLGGVGG